MSSSIHSRAPVTTRAVLPEDGQSLWRLAREVGLDLNSPYSYCLLPWAFPDSCRLAEDEATGTCLGFVTSLRPPDRPGCLFVWQIGVHPEARGRRVGSRLLDDLVETQPSSPTFVEATVTPSNGPSRALFEAFARRHGASLGETPLLSPDLFPGDHEAEHLLSIGPL